MCVEAELLLSGGLLPRGLELTRYPIFEHPFLCTRHQSLVVECPGCLGLALEFDSNSSGCLWLNDRNGRRRRQFTLKGSIAQELPVIKMIVSISIDRASKIILSSDSHLALTKFLRLICPSYNSTKQPSYTPAGIFQSRKCMTLEDEHDPSIHPHTW
jgi:hypothetical protein